MVEVALNLPKAQRDHAWFVGYAPTEDPQVAFAVVVEHGGHGGSMAAPIVRQVLEKYFGTESPVETETAEGGEGASIASAR